MRRIALINQKGGVGKTTTAVNLGAALAEAGRRVVLVDLDPQANLSLHLGQILEEGAPSTYRVLVGQSGFGASVRSTGRPGLSVVATDIHLSGAELELATAFGRETLLRDAVDEWVREAVAQDGTEPADYLIFDCPPSLGLLSINGLAAATEVFVAVQTEFFALQGMSKLVEIVDLIRKRMHPELRITGIVPCLYDSRLRLAREVLGELRAYFPDRVFATSIGTNVKLAEAPSFGQTILDYAPESTGARDYRALAEAVLAMEEPARAEEPVQELQPAPPASAPSDPEPSAAQAPSTAPSPAPAVEPSAGPSQGGDASNSTH